MQRVIGRVNNARNLVETTSAAVDTAIMNVDRDLEYASRSIDLSLAHLEQRQTLDATAGQKRMAKQVRIGIAMLLKDPNCTSLESFVRYHAWLGVSRFDFFLDDTTTRRETAAGNGSPIDAPECNDAAAAVLEKLGREFTSRFQHNFTSTTRECPQSIHGTTPGGTSMAQCPQVAVMVHRCSLAWWVEEQEAGEEALWTRWGPHLHTEVIARQVLAVAAAIRWATPQQIPPPATKASACSKDCNLDVESDCCVDQAGLSDELDSTTFKVDWLLHIDVDEALWIVTEEEAVESMTCSDGAVDGARINALLNRLQGAAGRFFASLPAELDQVTILNHEAAVEREKPPCAAIGVDGQKDTGKVEEDGDEVGDWFREITLFKRNPHSNLLENSKSEVNGVKGGCSFPFLAYTNGKSGVRLTDGVLPAGSHAFTSAPRCRRLHSAALVDPLVPPLPESEKRFGGADASPMPVLLHFPNAGFSEWRRKYRSLGPFADDYCSNPATPIPFKFHLASRDAMARSVVASNRDMKSRRASISPEGKERTQGGGGGGKEANLKEGHPDLEAELRELYRAHVIYDSTSESVRSGIDGTHELIRFIDLAAVITELWARAEDTRKDALNRSTFRFVGNKNSYE